MSLAWYVRRLRAMDSREIVARLRDIVAERRLDAAVGRLVEPPAPLVNAADVLENVAFPAEQADAIVACADRVVSGTWDVFGSIRTDMVDPDWFVDVRSGLHAPAGTPASRVSVRDWDGSLKHVWELSRHQYLTLVAAASAITGDPAYRGVVERHLRSWWEANPPRTGVHWVSGIELGIRLISWVWIRRLLDGMDGGELFEDDAVFRHQLRSHLLALDHLPSHGSSANNHLVAEAVGAFVAAAAFPMWPQSEEWQSRAKARVRSALAAQVDSDGVHRELSPGYHGFVAELFLLAALEGDLAGDPFPDQDWARIARMFDVVAATADCELHPARRNDEDDAVAVGFDPPSAPRTRVLLSTGATAVGAMPWWPEVGYVPGLAAVVAPMARGEVSEGRHQRRPQVFEESGTTVLRSEWDGSEAWLHLDGGPHGYLRTAAHGHADALSFEFRLGGTEILVDPGTNLYHGEPEERAYFRSTRAHNTLEIEGLDQAVSGGTFLWTAVPDVEVLAADPHDTGGTWSGSHDGYAERVDGLVHRRTVVLDESMLEVTDEVTVGAVGALHFHLGPEVDCRLESRTASLRWKTAAGIATARMVLPAALSWATVFGQEEPMLGWYSPSFGRRQPITTLVGTGMLEPGQSLVTILELSGEEWVE